MKVYLVEDSPILRERVIERILENGRDEVVGTAESEHDAIMDIAKLRPHVVVIDIQLKQGNGIRVLKTILGLNGYHPVAIVLTNHSDSQHRRVAIAAGASYFFDKSTEFNLFGETLDGLTPA